MNQNEAIKILSDWDKKGRFVFTKQEMGKIFQDEKQKTLTERLSRQIKSGLLENPCRNVYLYALTQHRSSRLIELIAIALRKGSYNYVSLESALSEYGAISQIPIDRLTVMTTGRSAVYQTPYGTIEFTHTDRAVSDILENTLVIQDRPLRIATKFAAWRDLKRVGRNIHLVDQSELNHEEP
ncbi:MAG: hypothetical protein EBX40_01425 [Gammaproteobacteria bacterium]|nr:hypothetical protein [Gammaproteobacteria bacterium]